MHLVRFLVCILTLVVFITPIAIDLFSKTAILKEKHNEIGVNETCGGKS